MDMSGNMVKISNLRFDPQNPRLPSTRSGNIEDAVFEYMLDKGAVTDVMLSIAENGYYNQEPLLVIPTGVTGVYEVIEGNRRLAALKLLLEPDLAPTKRGTVQQIVDEAIHKPLKVPVLEYANREEILLYLGYRHVTGVHAWDSLAKARYLHLLREKKFSHLGYPEALKAMAKTIGSGNRGDYVHKLLSGYLLYEKVAGADFYKIPGLNEETFSFSLLTTAMSYKNIADFIGANNNIVHPREDLGTKDDNLRELIEWMFKENLEGFTRLGESRNLKSLSAVVAHEAAVRAFREGRSLKEAEIFTDEPFKAFENAIDQATGSLRDAWSTLPSIEVASPYHLDKLKDLNLLLRNIFTAVNGKIVVNNLEELK